MNKVRVASVSGFSREQAGLVETVQNTESPILGFLQGEDK